MIITARRKLLLNGAEGACPFCEMPVSVSDLRDEASKNEFQISGICQKCQDKTFLTDKTTNL